MQLVQQLFLPFEHDRVPGILLSARMPDDTICWDLEKNGKYSVRSAYKAIFGDHNAESAAFASDGKVLWSKVWRLRVLKSLPGELAQMLYL